MAEGKEQNRRKKERTGCGLEFAKAERERRRMAQFPWSMIPRHSMSPVPLSGALGRGCLPVEHGYPVFHLNCRFDGQVGYDGNIIAIEMIYEIRRVQKIYVAYVWRVEYDCHMSSSVCLLVPVLMALSCVYYVQPNSTASQLGLQIMCAVLTSLIQKILITLNAMTETGRRCAVHFLLDTQSLFQQRPTWIDILMMTSVASLRIVQFLFDEPKRHEKCFFC